MTTKLRAEDIRGDASMPDGFSGGSCGDLVAGVIDGTKIHCAGVQADRLSVTMLGGENMKITAGTIDARALQRESTE